MNVMHKCYKQLKKKMFTAIEQCTVSDIGRGIAVSTTSISLENLDRIRPVGVVSKNVSGVLKTPFNIVL